MLSQATETILYNWQRSASWITYSVKGYVSVSEKYQVQLEKQKPLGIFKMRGI